MMEFILGFAFVMYVVMAALIAMSTEKFCEIFPMMWERVLVFVFAPLLLPVAITYGVFKKFKK